MPWVISKQTGKKIWVSDEAAAKGIQSGAFESDESKDVFVEDSEGNVSRLSAEEAHRASLTVDRAGGDSVAAAKAAEADEALHGGVSGTARTVIEGAYDSATLGGYSTLARASNDRVADDMATRARINPGSRVAGEVAGMFLPGGAAKAGQLGAKIAKVGEAGNLATRAGYAALGAGAEGAIISSGQYISQVALQDKELSGEAFVGAVGNGALWGAGAGAAFTGIGALSGAVGRKLDDVAKARNADEVAKTLSKKIGQEEKSLARLKELRAKEAIRRESAEGKEMIKSWGAKERELEKRATAQAKGEIDLAKLGVKKETQALRTEATASRTQAAEARANATIKKAESQTAKADARVRVQELKRDTAHIYTDGWRDVNASKLMQRKVSADAKTRSSLAKAIVDADSAEKMVRLDALTPKSMRSEKAIAVARQKADEGISRAIGDSVDLVNTTAHIPDPQIQAATHRLISATDNLSAIGKAGADDVGAGLAAIREQEAAIAALVDQAKPHLTPEQAAAFEQRVASYRSAQKAKEGATGLTGKDGAELAAAFAISESTEDMPVIGDLAKAYLFSRIPGVRGMVSRGPLASIAEKAAGMQDKVEDAVRMFAKAGEKLTRAPRGAAGVAATLSQPLYMSQGSEEPPKQSRSASDRQEARDNYKKRLAELTAAARNPEGVRTEIRRRLPAGAPEVLEPIEQTFIRKLQFLEGKAPKDPQPPTLGPSRWEPNDVELSTFANYLRAVENPVTVLEDMQRGELTPEGAEALKAVYPRLFREVQSQILENLGELKEDLPYPKRVQLSILFDVPADDSMRPEVLGALQEGYQQPPSGPPQPSIDGPVGLAEISEYGPNRRSAR